MERSDSPVREKLLAAGKKEFLEYGYEKASLRRICRAAGVTTGALYFCFQNKEDLFAQIVSGTIAELEALSRRMIISELADPSVGADNEKEMLSFLWKNRDVILLLGEKSGGTKYEGFRETLMQQLEDAFARFFQKYGNEADWELIRILVEMKTKGYMELIMGGYTFERTRRLAEMLGWYTDGGFEVLMQKMKSEHVCGNQKNQDSGRQNKDGV